MDGVVLLVIFIFLLVIALSAFWIWMIVDCANNEPAQGNTQLMWIIIIISLHWFGALIYLLARRPTRIRELGR